MVEVVNASKLAGILGTSRAGISKAVKAGRLTPLVADGGKMLFDLDSARAEWADRPNARPTRGDTPAAPDVAPNSSPGGVASPPRQAGPLTSNQKLLKTKIAREAYEAGLRKLRLEKERGELIPVETVRQQGAELGAILVGALISFPKRISEQVATMTDSHAIRELMMGDINKMIESVRKLCGFDDSDTGVEPTVKDANAATEGED